MGFLAFIKNLFKKSEDVLFSPEKCICCGREKIDESSPFCDKCKNNITFIENSVCDKCGAPINLGKVCDKCKEDKYYFDKARSAVKYDEFSSPMITRFKYSKAKYLENRLSDILVELYKKYDLHADFVTYTPMTKKKERERGFNQTKALCESFCEKTNLEQIEILIKVKETKVQAGLDKNKRKTNLVGAFDIIKENKKLIKNKKILLIDDVFTTGSTVNECAKMLKKHGADSVFVLTIAKTLTS